MVTEEVKKHRLDFDQQKHDQTLDSANYYGLKCVQGGINAWDNLGLKRVLDISDLESMRDPEAFIREVVYQESAALQALPIEKEHALSMIKLPQGSGEFITAVKMIQQSYNWMPTDGKVNAARFDVYKLDGRRVVITEALKNIAEQLSSTYTRTEEDAEIYEFFEEFAPKIKALAEKYPSRQFLSVGASNDGILREFVNINSNKKVIQFYPKSILK